MVLCPRATEVLRLSGPGVKIGLAQGTCPRGQRFIRGRQFSDAHANHPLEFFTYQFLCPLPACLGRGAFSYPHPSMGRTAWFPWKRSQLQSRSAAVGRQLSREGGTTQWRHRACPFRRLFRRKCGSGGEEHPAPEQIEVGMAVSLTLRQLELARLSLRLPTAPRCGERDPHCGAVLLRASSDDFSR